MPNQSLAVQKFDSRDSPNYRAYGLLFTAFNSVYGAYK